MPPKMTKGTDQKIFEDALRFSGAVSASLSHEINNVLAIVGELSGLLGDYLVAVENGKEPSPEKRQRTADKIAVQMERGKHHIQQLNRFAHSVDKPEIEFDAKENCEYTLSLLERFARLRKVELKPSLDKVSKHFKGSPFEFQHVVFRAVELMILLAKQQASISIDLTEKPAGIALCFSCPELDKRETVVAVSERLALLETLTARTNGSCQADYQQGEQMKITLELPCTFSFREKNSGRSR